MLYTVNKPALTSGNIFSALRIARPGDPILFLEDGVYVVAGGASTEELVKGILEKHPLYALRADIDARGMKAPIEGVQVIDYDGFVGLVEEHDVAPWL